MINLNKVIQNAFVNELQKLAEESQLKQGIEVEKEHIGTLNKIKESISGDNVTMSTNEILTNIAKDHLKEKKNYYTLLKKHVEKE